MHCSSARLFNNDVGTLFSCLCDTTRRSSAQATKSSIYISINPLRTFEHFISNLEQTEPIEKSFRASEHQGSVRSSCIHEKKKKKVKLIDSLRDLKIVSLQQDLLYFMAFRGGTECQDVIEVKRQIMHASIHEAKYNFITLVDPTLQREFYN